MSTRITVMVATYALFGVICIAIGSILRPASIAVVVYGWSAGLAIVLTEIICRTIKESRE